MTGNAYITSLAAFLPGKPVQNEEMEAILGMVGNRPSRARRLVLRSNGIVSRHYVIDPTTGETTHSNAALAAEAIRALANDAFSPNDIDCLACGTSLADQLMPNHTSMVHGELGTPPCETVSTAGVCLSGVAAMKYAAMGVRCGEFQHAVAAASESASPLMRARLFQQEVDTRVEQLETNPEIAFEKDFLRWMLSDGAGAVLIEPQPAKKGMSLRIDWIVEKSYASEMPACMYSGAEKLEDGRLKGWLEFTPQEWLDRSVFALKQDVKQLNAHIIHYTVEKTIADVAARKGLSPRDIDWFLPHYSSNYFRDKVCAGLTAAEFAIPYERWFTNLTTKGNTGSAAIYIMLEELMHSGKVQLGQRLLAYVPESGRFSSAFIHFTACDATSA